MAEPVGVEQYWQQGCRMATGVKVVIVTHVPPPLDEAWQLESSEALIVLLKKIN